MPRVLVVGDGDPVSLGSSYVRGFRKIGCEASLFDHYFVWAEHLVQRIRALGVPRVSYLGFAVDPELSYPVAHEEPGIEVSFVGTWDQYRESWLHILAEAVPLSIWGSDYWRDRCRSPL